MNNKSNFDFDSKANTLAYLRDKIKKSYIEKMYVFYSKDWSNKENILKEIRDVFGSSKIVIRSSAKGEDSFQNSLAGSYQSILNVKASKRNEVVKAVNKVIESYDKKSNFSLENQVLVQEQTSSIKTSGVIFTRDYDGSPYYVINYDDGEKTDSVTSGVSGNVIKLFRNAKFSRIPDKWKKLLQAVEELESILRFDALDIEFAIKKDDSIVIFQARPLIISNYDRNDAKVRKLIQRCKREFKNNAKKGQIYSDMADWNPSEIIGNDPNLLDYTLYDFLIMGDAWTRGREIIGYSSVHNKSLMKKFGNKPYVDVLASFDSLTPANISGNLRKAIILNAMEKLREKPYLHDKIEFEVLFTCFDLSISERLKELRAYLSKEEIAQIRKLLLEFTNKVIEKFPQIIDECNKRKEKMEQNRKQIQEDLEKDQNISRILSNVRTLLKDCKNYGTVYFSTIARIAFISNIILKSLLKEKIISNESYESISNSIESPLSEFKNDYQHFCQKSLSKEDFLKKYGHLRQGTYDITAKTYNDDNEFLSSVRFYEGKSFKVKNLDMTKINEGIGKSGLKFDKINFYDFVYASTREREVMKFEFTKNLSYALELIALAGSKMGFSRSDLSYLDIRTILKFDKNREDDLSRVWSEKIKKEKKRRESTSLLVLPPLIFSEDDFDVISYYLVKPNFITKKSITKNILLLDNLTKKREIMNSIILLEKADPGYDWIFTYHPAGLITKYGGAASHMAIRCYELGLPAAIGSGDLLYNELKKALRVKLDCESEKISILQNTKHDEDLEVRKTLQSLGYIR